MMINRRRGCGVGANAPLHLAKVQTSDLRQVREMMQGGNDASAAQHAIFQPPVVTHRTMPARVFAAIKSYFKDAGAKPEILPVTGEQGEAAFACASSHLPQALCSAPASALPRSSSGSSATRPTCRSTPPPRRTTRSSRASRSTTLTRRAACSEAGALLLEGCLGAFREGMNGWMVILLLILLLSRRVSACASFESQDAAFCM